MDQLTDQGALLVDSYGIPLLSYVCAVDSEVMLLRCQGSTTLSEAQEDAVRDYCGVVLSRGRRVCDDCRPDEQAEDVRRYVAGGQAALREQHSRGLHPGHTTEANRKRGRTVSRAATEAKAWERAHSRRWDASVFTREILPGLQGKSAGQVARAAGIGVGYASQVIKGLRTAPKALGGATASRRYVASLWPRVLPIAGLSPV